MFMDFKFSKDSSDSRPEEAPGEKKKQSALLVLLLILVGGFTYLYFFTGLIKPQEAQKAAEVPTPAPQVVKMPLPAREGEPAKPDGKASEKVEAPKAAATAPVTTAAPAAKPADKKPQPVPVADKKGDKAAVIKADAKKPAADAKKSVVTEKKNVSAKVGLKKPVSDGQAKPKSVVKAKKAAPGSWSLVVGNYVLEEALSADMGRVRKAGFEPIIKPAARKKTTMNRLFVSEFNDRATAQPTLEKLKRHTSDAFVIEQDGRFAVYAGSYLQSESASFEKERLKTAGFSVTVKHSDISIPSQSLSVGPFNSKNAADAALGRLKNTGIKATFSQN
jgi:cell division septation protein DedD